MKQEVDTSSDATGAQVLLERGQALVLAWMENLDGWEEGRLRQHSRLWLADCGMEGAREIGTTTPVYSRALAKLAWVERLFLAMSAKAGEYGELRIKRDAMEKIMEEFRR